MQLQALCGDGGGDVGSKDGGGGGEAVKLISRDEFSLITPSVPRKTSGGALGSSAADGGGEAGVSVTAAATLLLERSAARWLTLAAARVVLATFVGCARVVFRPFLPAVVGSTTFTVLAVFISLLPPDGSTATSAKGLVVVGVLVLGAVTFTALAGGAASLLGWGGG